MLLCCCLRFSSQATARLKQNRLVLRNYRLSTKQRPTKGHPLKWTRSSRKCTRPWDHNLPRLALIGSNLIRAPEEFPKSETYWSYVRNLAINFVASPPVSVEQMPLMQLYSPANPYSLESDHCYQSSSYENCISYNKRRLFLMQVLTR